MHRAALGIITAAAVWTGPHVAAAATARVSLGEVSTRVVRPDVDLGAVLRAAIQSELNDLSPATSGEKGPYVLSAALVRMETDAGRVSCVVSATIRTARGGTMLAIVEGRARVESQGQLSLFDVRRAVEGAARAAVVRVPEALR